MNVFANESPRDPDVDVEADVAVEPRGEHFLVTCTVCGSLGTQGLEVAAAEVQRWHQARHTGHRLLQLTLTVEEMRRLREMARDRAQTPEDLVRDILSHALEERRTKASAPRGPRLRLVG